MIWYPNQTRRQSYLLISWIFVLLLAVFFLPRLVAAGTPLKSATLMPLWSPQAQFAGYYVALEKGIYARYGIDLKILRAGPGHSPADALRKGTTDFAVLWLTTALQHRIAGTHLVNLAQINQRSSMMLISRKTSGIHSIADMEGKKVGLWEGDVSIPPRAIFARNRTKVREVRQSHSVNLFLRGGIDVTSAMWYNEYHTIINSGIDPEELNVMFLRDQGMNFLEDGIYTMNKTLQKDPSLAAAFVDASLEGWRYAFDHPDETLDIVIKYMREAHLPANRVQQKWMLDRMRDLMMPVRPTGKMGFLAEQDYEAVGLVMQENGLIRKYPAYRDFVWRANAVQK
ncbi:ABC transporter substrate-binding protein [Candidatus Nitrotoga fabula]|uniref:Thiamine pyrimidine synthase n=1 Tax=Candidatus Nitrotoga fabula TaxID=2182327 RepID=A0A916F9E1_9PROT|nr:ABC transporter substrate-binding protein [Candidatus Nitrotoga fabula]CAE6690215.1 Putative ABC-type transport system, periplasmic component [Candidatus Nitrotoga fabula]